MVSTFRLACSTHHQENVDSKLDSLCKYMIMTSSSVYDCFCMGTLCLHGVGTSKSTQQSKTVTIRRNSRTRSILETIKINKMMSDQGQGQERIKGLLLL